jgi:hypothetical protein
MVKAFPFFATIPVSLFLNILFVTPAVLFFSIQKTIIAL